MTDSDAAETKPDHEPPKGAEIHTTWAAGNRALDYTATAEWMVLRKDDKPAAEVFSVSYVADSRIERPVTFLFNGGPGASSAYLHVGTVGPQRVEFPADGSLPTMPARLIDNEASWLAFTDLVFIDPVGTGFSRIIETKDSGDDSGKKQSDPKEFFGVQRDLEAMAEFIARWLSENKRWGSPVFIAGESYGGFRVAKLTRMLQEQTGVGLNGAILISPALELATLSPTDYDMLAWIDMLPTMALAAAHHGRSRLFDPDSDPRDIVAETEEFATTEYPVFLAQGASMGVDERERVLFKLADLVGLPFELVLRLDGRIPMQTFARELLRDERKVIGLYDTTVTAIDPFPDREPFAGPDPTLAGYGSAYTAAINRLLRQEIGVETDREYKLLNYEVNNSWKVDMQRHALAGAVGSTDDFRFGMSLNPHMRAFICHGRHDLVTPYYSSDRLSNLMRLDDSVAGRITLQHFDGGHMFYAWEESRMAFRDAISDFVETAT